MRSKTSRSVLAFSAIIIAVLVVAQVMWLYKIYQYEQKEFRTSVIKCMRGVYEEVELLESSVIRMQALVEQKDPTTFFMKVNCLPGKDTLLNAVTHNLEDFGIFTDCDIAVYNHLSDRIIFTAYVPSVGGPEESSTLLEAPQKKYSYILLHFPHVKRYIAYAMRWWIFSMGLILLVMLAFGLTLYYLYRQKFINEIQNDFIRNVTHEFQTPLTTLTFGLDALSKTSLIEQPAKREHYIHLLKGQTQYLKQHIENLMKVLTAESRGLILQKMPVSMDDLIERAIEQLSYSIEEKHAIIEYKKGERFLINADASSLLVAIINILSNAIKYSMHPVIKISCKMQSNYCFIEVKDNGIGINENQQKKIFKKFYRITEGDVHDVKGLGLGLYFTKKVIDAHKGTIKINSKQGEGTEFIIEIPV